MMVAVYMDLSLDSIPYGRNEGSQGPFDGGYGVSPASL